MVGKISDNLCDSHLEPFVPAKLNKQVFVVDLAMLQKLLGASLLAIRD